MTFLDSSHWEHRELVANIDTVTGFSGHTVTGNELEVRMARCPNPWCMDGMIPGVAYDETAGRGHTVIYRRRDILGFVDRLRRKGIQLDLNLHPGRGPLDAHIDLPPYVKDPHVKLLLESWVTTSIGLAIRKPS